MLWPCMLLPSVVSRVTNKHVSRVTNAVTMYMRLPLVINYSQPLITFNWAFFRLINAIMVVRLTIQTKCIVSFYSKGFQPEPLQTPAHLTWRSKNTASTTLKSLEQLHLKPITTFKNDDRFFHSPWFQFLGPVRRGQGNGATTFETSSWRDSFKS